MLILEDLDIIYRNVVTIYNRLDKIGEETSKLFLQQQ